MLLVLDANVLIEGLSNAQSSSGRLLNGVLREQVTLAWCDEIMYDYAVVMGYEGFALDATRADKLLAFIQENGKKVNLSKKFGLALPDTGDTAYYCCAADAACPLVTGNINNFPMNGPVEIMNPARVLFEDI